MLTYLPRYEDRSWGSFSDDDHRGARDIYIYMYVKLTSLVYVGLLN